MSDFEDDFTPPPAPQDALDDLLRPIDLEDGKTKRDNKDETADEPFDPILREMEREVEQARAQTRADLLGPSAFDDHIEYLNPGAHFDLIAHVPILKHLKVGAGWDQRRPDDVIDVDLSAFLLGRDDKTRVDEDFIFYNNESGCEGAIRHKGDSRTGAGDGDDEEIFIDLKNLPFDIFKIVLVVTVYEDIDRGKHLGLVTNAYVRLVNEEDDREICRVALSDGIINKHKGIHVGTLHREGPNWVFECLAKPFERGNLAAAATQYGILVKELQSSGD